MVMAIFDTNQAKVHVYIKWLWIKEKIALNINFIVAQIQHLKHNSIICNDYQKNLGHLVVLFIKKFVKPFFHYKEHSNIQGHDNSNDYDHDVTNSCKQHINYVHKRLN